MPRAGSRSTGSPPSPGYVPLLGVFEISCDGVTMMADAQVHKVRFEPVGIEMEVEEGETVLDAAFRQGISLMHGC